MAVKVAECNKKQEKARLQEERARVASEVSLESQERLAEILNDSPRLVSLNGTEWEIRALRMGTQYLIAQEVIKINKVENANFGDIVKQFAVNIPSLFLTTRIRYSRMAMRTKDSRNYTRRLIRPLLGNVR